MGHMRTISQAVPLLNGGRLEFYRGGGYGVAVERIGGEITIDRSTSPQRQGTLRWKAVPGASTRPGGVLALPALVDVDYAVTGLDYTPAAATSSVFSPSATSAVLSMTPATTLVTRTLSLTGGSTIGFSGGAVGINLSTGIFSGSYAVAPNVRRTFYGVVLQGGGIRCGRGFIFKPGESSPVLLQP